MKKTILAIAVSFALVFAASAQTKTPQPAKMVLGQAIDQAKAQKKNVLLAFGASWCKWCKALDTMIDSKEVGKIFHDNFVIAHLTIQEHPDKVSLENPGAQAFADASGAKGQGIPIYLFYDAAGKPLANSMAMKDGGNIGFPATPEEIIAFDGVLKKAAPGMTEAQRKQVSDYIRKQKVE
jgi:thioredoxin-related protein